jgi:hypothetical protein
VEFENILMNSVGDADNSDNLLTIMTLDEVEDNEKTFVLD